MTPPLLPRTVRVIDRTVEGGPGFLTPAKVSAIMPRLSDAKLALYYPHLVAAMAEWQIDTPARASAFLAQLAHESGELRWMQEIASGAAYDNRADLGNTRPEAIRIAKAHGTTPGRFWKGHGPIQITGYDNHLAVAGALGINCLTKPHLLTEPEYAFRGAGWFWDSRDLNELADEGEFRRVTRGVNGGVNGLKERVDYWLRAMRVLGAEL
jgi:putative chitinase